jgi:Alpha-2,8-polysialyltransferase (POLYST)
VTTTSFPALPAATGGTPTQIFLASTLYGAATLAAALDAGLFAPSDRRLLVVSNNASVPETTPGLDAMPGFAVLRDRFDDVLSWNETISPFHPGDWAPRPDDVPMWERYLRMLWGLGDGPLEIVVESIQVEPALAVAQCFPDSVLHVYADGLMSYGPTRNKLDILVHSRIRRLLHLDLVTGLKPLLLAEHGVPARVVPAESFLEVLAEVGRATEDLPGLPEAPALLLGQYLSALGILSADEEEELHLRMLRGVVKEGHRSIVFKPHPTAPARWSRALEEEAQTLGVELTVLDRPVLAEVLYQRIRPALVVGCFSTALLTASAFYDLPVARVGTALLLERLAPYQNSNRVPVTLVDALLRDLENPGEAEVPHVAELVEAVGYCMQAQTCPHLREAAVEYLRSELSPRTWRYFKRRRLTALGLPGAVPSQLSRLPRNPTVRRVARRARALKRSALG